MTLWWQVPQGATPRSLHLQMKGELTRCVKPGDSVTITGIHLTEPYTGFKAMRAGLLTSTYTEAMHVEHNKQSYADLQLSSDKDSFLSVSTDPQHCLACDLSCAAAGLMSSASCVLQPAMRLADLLCAVQVKWQVCHTFAACD